MILSISQLQAATHGAVRLEQTEKGIEPLLKKHGGVRRDSLKTVLYKLKKKLLG